MLQTRMFRTPTLRCGMLSACVIAAATLPAGIARAQEQQSNSSGYTDQPPGYTSAPAVGLDKNFGLPSFGMPGADLPQQRATAPDQLKADPQGTTDSEQPATAPDEMTTGTTGESDPFEGSTPIELPKSGTSASAATGMETPLFTTTNGSTLGTARGDMDTTTGTTTGDSTSSTSPTDQ